MLAKNMVNGSNKLCYAYILGKCQGRICGKCPYSNAPVSDINDSFAQALCNALSKGIQQCLTMEPPRTQHQFLSGSHTGKWYK